MDPKRNRSSLDPYWDSSVAVGSPFTTTLIFDNAAPPTFPNDLNEAQYPTAPLFATLSFGNYNFVFDTHAPDLPPKIGIRDNYNGDDAYYWFWSTPTAQYGLNSPFTHGFLVSSDLSLINSVGLDIKEFDISYFNIQHNRQLIGYDALNNPIVINFDVMSYSVTPVPEPSTVVLSAIGFLTILLWIQRSKRS